MIPELGHFALILALLLALAQAVLPLAGAARGDRTLDGGRAARGARAGAVRRGRVRLPAVFVRRQRFLGRQRRQQLQLAAAAALPHRRKLGRRTKARCCCGC